MATVNIINFRHVLTAEPFQKMLKYTQCLISARAHRNAALVLYFDDTWVERMLDAVVIYILLEHSGMSCAEELYILLDRDQLQPAKDCDFGAIARWIKK